MSTFLLVAALTVVVLLLAVVMAASYRPALLAAPLFAARAVWRRATSADYGRHAPSHTPPHGIRMRDHTPAGGGS